MGNTIKASVVHAIEMEKAAKKAKELALARSPRLPCSPDAGRPGIALRAGACICQPLARICTTRHTHGCSSSGLQPQLSPQRSDELHSLAQKAQTWPITVDQDQVRTITALLNEAERTLGRPVPPQPPI